MSVPAEYQIKFLQNVQRILEEGLFTASYKYALLIALADLAVEKGDDSGSELPISLDEIAEKFIRYYWRQARPYRGTIVDQPLWKLQRVGDEVLDFLYPHSLTAGQIVLKPGVAFCLRRFHGLVYDLVTAAWLRFVRELRPNQHLFGQATDLAEFLFGTERSNLNCVRPVLRDIQRGGCFYCSRQLTASADVDHFIPWSRYPVDLGHNFVLADPACNNKKRHRLAAVPHLERWVRRNADYHLVLAEQFEKNRVVHDAATSLGVARWAYAQAHDAQALAWQHGNELVPISPDWALAVGV
jgi:hypothetical protein